MTTQQFLIAAALGTVLYLVARPAVFKMTGLAV